jgi:archaellum component FlaF (FlaF/FlaG flagellin family)
MLKLSLSIFSLILLPTFAFAGELTKVTVVDKMEVLSAGHVQVREAVRVIEDGKVVSQQFHRYVVSPGDDYSKKDAKVKAVCAKVHTQTVIDAYKHPVEPVVTPGLVKETKVNKIHVLEDGTLVADKVTRVLDSGKEIGKSKVTEKIVPGDDITAKEVAVKDIATVIQTKDVIDAYKAAHPEAVVKPVYPVEPVEPK